MRTYTPRTIRGYAAKEKGLGLESFTYDPPSLGKNEVRVSVTHCGLCYTDIHAIDDYYGITTYPFVPGHEIVGHVSELGSEVVELKIGDRVAIGWQGYSCMHCEWCLKGEEHLCTDVVNNGSWTPYGGFSSSIKVDSRFAYQLPQNMLSEVAAVLMCAGITVYSPLRMYVKDSSQKVGVIGIGGLGHLAIQFARAFGCEVTAISSTPEKEEWARALGATDFIVAKNKDSFKESQLSFDLLLYTAHAQIDWTSLLLTLKNNGKLVMMGFSPVPVTFEPMDLIVHQHSITGSFVGSRATMREMLSLAQSKGIKPKIEVMPMKLVNEAIRKLKETKPSCRIVLVNDESSM